MHPSLCHHIHYVCHHLQITRLSRFSSCLPVLLLFQAVKVCSGRMLVHTLPGTLRALLRVLVFSTASGAFQVSPSSPCSSQCTTDGAVNTDTSEIVCSDADFSTTSSGLKFRDCIQCLQTSRYSLGNESDVDWFFCKPEAQHCLPSASRE